MSALKPENEEISLSIDEFLNLYRMSDKDKLTMRNTHTTIPNYPRGSGAYHTADFRYRLCVPQPSHSFVVRRTPHGTTLLA